ncbi:MAG: YicC family protein [Planctomycetaceae bacterium]|nr:YicC family protein [Planctomycetaceae bacterium]
MLLSMTGQGAATAFDDNATVTVEIRAVNNRHLKVNLRAPDSLISSESAFEKLIRQNVGRGTVNVSVKLEKTTRKDDFTLDLELIQSYRQQLKIDDGDNQSLDALLSLPGVVISRSQSNKVDDATVILVCETLQQALQQFNQMREVEGASMAEDLLVQLEELNSRVQTIRELAPGVINKYSQRLTDKLNGLLEKHNLTISDSDVTREIGIFADRCDITEEVVRLDSHISQFRSVVQGHTSQGRKLDFITQELFREINTIGSKANDTEIANTVVECKTIIERIREQVQNIE